MNRPGSAISKAKVTKSSGGEGTQMRAVSESAMQIQQKIPTLQEYIKDRDWVGAIAFLEYERNLKTNVENSLWLAYCSFHMGEYKKAIQIYDELIRNTDNPETKEYYAYKACCYYALCQYDDAKREALKGPENELQVRLLFHIAHKKNDEKNLMNYHQKLQETTHDQLCLAAIHYLRGHHEEATEIYKKILLETRDYQAINAYIALCYYKMEYFDVSMEILSGYLNFDPQSIYATNLKACNNYQLYSGKNAEEVLKPLQQLFKGGDIFKESDLLRHNLVVFRNGENAMQTLPPLIDVFPEAKLNLVIYHLKKEQVAEAFNLIKDIEPTAPREYILKGVVYAMYGQAQDSREHIKTAQQLFQLVGASSTECDTIPGRQCMASCFFLLKQFDDVLVYLKSIRNYFQTDDDFNWNYAIACAYTGDFKEAEEAFLLVRNERYRNEDIFLRWLIRTYIMNGKPKAAWDVYLSMESTADSFNILEIIGNDCYQMGHFFYALKAFEALEKVDNDKDYDEALRGSVIGVFQMVIAAKEPGEHLMEALAILKSVPNNPQDEYVFKIIKKWAKDNRYDLEEMGL